MTVGELKATLKEYSADAHIVVAVTTVPVRKGKLEVREVWSDSYGVVNILLSQDAGALDNAIYSENEMTDEADQSEVNQ